MLKSVTTCVTLLAVMLHASAQGHWHLIHSANAEWSEIEFIDTANGFVFGSLLDGTGEEIGPYVLRTSDGGDTWTDVSPPAADFELSSAWLTDALHGTAVGRNGGSGAIATTDDGGTTWSVDLGSASERLNGVAYADANNGFICGRDGFMLRTANGGVSWQPFSIGFGDDLSAVYFVTSTKAFIVGDEGYIATTNDGGNTWNEITSPTTNELTSIFFLNPDTGWICGDLGTILQTTDGGASWQLQEPGSSSAASVELTDIAAVSGSKAWTGGEPFIFLTTNNGGAAWENDTALTTQPITALEAKGNAAWLTDEGGNIFKWSSSNGGAVPTALHQPVLFNEEPSCRFETFDLVLNNIPVHTTSINVYNVLGQRVIRFSTQEQTSLRVPFESESGLYFVELRDASNGVLSVMKAVKR